MKYAISGNFFNNQFHLPPTSGLESVETIIRKKSPANLEQILWEAPVDYRHINPIIDSVMSGFDLWRNQKIEHRISLLKKFQQELSKRSQILLESISLETGFPSWEVDIDIQDAISKIDFLIENSLPRISELQIKQPNNTSQLHHIPVGPCLIITPFNKNLISACEFITTSLLAGNSIIFKPSERMCYSSQIIVEALVAAQFPSGVINLIHGDAELTRRICRERKIKCIFFTGSKEAGKDIMDIASPDLHKTVLMALSSKNATILCKDANIDVAIPTLLQSCFLSAGQRCSSTSIVPIHKSLIGKVVSKFHELTKRIIIDHPTIHPSTPFMGPLIDEQSLNNYLLFIGMAKRSGFEEIMRGKAIEKKHPGYYASPSICLASKFDPKNHFLTSEFLAPNCTFIPFDEVDEAINICNSLDFGLITSIFTNSDPIKQKCLDEIQSGTINFNISTLYSNPNLPIVGIKNSGNNRSWGIASIDSCVYTRSSNENIGNSVPSINGIM